KKNNNMLIKSIAVFCGSKSGTLGLFAAEAAKLGRWMASKNIRLIYGGGRVGLMSAVADAVMNSAGADTSVILQVLDSSEHAEKILTVLLVVVDMHSRKSKMYDLCDAHVILPCCYGTLDELFEMITWNNLSIHDIDIY